MDIIPYEERYRDDLIFMVLQAKDALGRIPRLSEDLLDIRAHYTDRGDVFFLAVEDGRVVGCAGCSGVLGGGEVFLHRLYVKASMKRRGIGSALLGAVEDWLRGRGVRSLHVHLGSPPEQWYESRAFYPKHGFREYAPCYMVKDLGG